MRFAELVEDELARSRSVHRPMVSPHEALSVIWEELEEFKAQVFRKPAARSPEQMLSELVQCAAMCQRVAPIARRSAPLLAGVLVLVLAIAAVGLARVIEGRRHTQKRRVRPLDLFQLLKDILPSPSFLEGRGGPIVSSAPPRRVS